MANGRLARKQAVEEIPSVTKRTRGWPGQRLTWSCKMFGPGRPPMAVRSGAVSIEAKGQE